MSDRFVIHETTPAADRRFSVAVARLATVLLPVTLYILSFGPACWLCERQRLGIEWVYRAYRPLIWTSWQLRQHDFPDPVGRYAGLWANDSLLYELRATEAYRPLP